MKMIKKTKITATLGPSVTGNIFTWQDFNNPEKADNVKKAYETMASIFDAGVNVVRFNFSHGTHEEQEIRLKIARDVAKQKNLNISTMLDTKGPEVRVYKLKEKEILIMKDSFLTIKTIEKVLGDETTISVYDSTNTYNMAKDVKVGDPIFIDDGKLQLEVISVDIDNGIIETYSKNQWTIKENKRINLPNAEYTIPFMSQRDIDDIIFGINNNFDYIAASFVNSAKNVKEIRDLLKKHNAEHIQIVSKIESMSAINSITEIIEASDSIMVARGDLGLEIPYYEVPYYEKYIIKACRHMGKTVIVATQMLDSLETKMQATRAEVTDVFFAVERGADSTMLSGETANGLYPVNTVDVMTQINKTSETLFDYERAINVYFKNTPFYRTYAGKIAKKIASLVQPERVIANSHFDYSAIVYFGNNKNFVKALSNIRAASPIFFVTDKKENLTAFGLNYGVFTYKVDDLVQASKDYTKVVDEIYKNLPERKSTIVIVNGKFTEV